MAKAPGHAGRGPLWDTQAGKSGHIEAELCHPTPDKGVNIREVQRLLGHKGLETTTVCFHVIKNLQRFLLSPLGTLGLGLEGEKSDVGFLPKAAAFRILAPKAARSLEGHLAPKAPLAYNILMDGEGPRGEQTAKQALDPIAKEPVRYSQGELARFFVPLALQAASQSLTYPLVAMVASRGEAGPLGLAGLAQSNLVMFFLAMVGAGIPTAGMVFGKNREGWRSFAKMNLLMGLSVAAFQAVLCLPPLAHLLFGELIGLPPSIEAPASQTLFGTVLLQFLFFLRNPYQTALLLARASGKASIATMGRILLTGLMTLLFTLTGWVGVSAAVVCLTLPVGLEVVCSILLARPYIKSLPRGSVEPPSLGQLLRFVLPLSAGGVVLALSGPTLGAFIARAGEPERTLPVYYLAMGLASPMAFSASRIQSLVLAFPPLKGKMNEEVRKFCLKAGAILGVIPLLFLLPPLAEAYYVFLQKLPMGDLSILRVTAVALSALPLCVALRSYKEGLAAWTKRPVSVLVGQISHLCTLCFVSAMALYLGVPGHLMGPMGLVAGNLAASRAIGFMLKRRENPAP